MGQPCGISPWPRCGLLRSSTHPSSRSGFGGRLDGSRIYWETDRFYGYGWETAEDTLMLKLDRLDEPGAYYIEMINIAPDGQSRARTWQWFKDGRPWKRTLCDEWRIDTP